MNMKNKEKSKLIKQSKSDCPKCRESKEATFVCSNLTCQQIPFMCKQEKCNCKQFHVKCASSEQWKPFQEQAYTRIIKNHPKTKIFAQKIKQLFLEIQKSLQQSYETFLNWTEHMGFNNEQYSFHRLLKQNNYNQLKGSQIGVLKKLFEKDVNEYLWLNETLIEKVQKNANLLIRQLNVIYLKKNTDNLERSNLKQKSKQKQKQIQVTLPERSPHNAIQSIQVLEYNHQAKIQEKQLSNQKSLVQNNVYVQQVKQYDQIMKQEDIFQPYCIYGNLAMKVCAQQNCAQHAFLCDKIQCQCNSRHRRCNQIRWVTLIQKLNQKIKKNNEFYKRDMEKLRFTMENGFLNIQKIYKKFNNQISLIGLNNIEVQFYQLIEQKKFKQVQGKIIFMIDRDLKNNSSINSQFLQNEQQIITDTFNTLAKQMEKIFQQPTQQELLLEDYAKFANKFDSKIINQQKDKLLLFSFFRPRRLKGCTLLYRASQNNFSTHKFHNKCDGVANTITLIKTQFGNIIGGFTPLKWNRSRHNIFEVDLRCESFIFSITLKEKMELIYPEKAIQNHDTHGPRFGSADIVISDYANQNNDSRAYFPSSYNNGSYKNNQQSYSKFSGQVNGYLFRVEEWEVFTVDFL